MAGPGQPKTGGRVKGALNKATAAVKEAIVAAFNEVGGKDYLVQVARSDPRVFCTLLSKLVPAQIQAELEVSEPPQIFVVTGIENSPGAFVDDGAKRRRKAALGSGESHSARSDAAIELAKSSVVEMENTTPEPHDKPQPQPWVPLRPDDDRPTRAQLD